MLNSFVIEQDLKKEVDHRKLVSKIIYANEKYVKLYCEGFLNSAGQLCIKLWGICEDSSITIKEEVLDRTNLSGIFKVMFLHGVMPLD